MGTQTLYKYVITYTNDSNISVGHFHFIHRRKGFMFRHINMLYQLVALVMDHLVFLGKEEKNEMVLRK